MVGWPASMRGKHSVHFSALPVRWLKYTFLYGQPDTQNRQPAAAVLVDQHDAVLFPLVHRAGRAGGDAGRVEAVLADPRQVEHEHLLEGQLHLLG